MGDETLLVLVRTASYAVPGGFHITISHVGDCLNSSRDEELVCCVWRAWPMVMTELVTAAKEAIAVIVCPVGCCINKDNLAGIWNTEHSQDSSFAASSDMTACSRTGTCSLVSERVIEGVQGTECGEVAISELNFSEKALYNNMNLKLDRSSDKDYVPSSVVVGDNAIKVVRLGYKTNQLD